MNAEKTAALLETHDTAYTCPECGADLTQPGSMCLAGEVNADEAFYNPGFGFDWHTFPMREFDNSAIAYCSNCSSEIDEEDIIETPVAPKEA